MRHVSAIGIALITLLTAASPVAARASLRVIDDSPFSVRGAGFVPGERVTVLAQVEGRHVRVVTADKTGLFMVRFLAVSLGNCSAYIIRATGNRGSRAYLRFIPECTPLDPSP